MPAPAPAGQLHTAPGDDQGYMLASILTFQQLRREAIAAEMVRVKEFMALHGGSGSQQEVPRT
jgi:hypothetical protein